MNKYTPKDICRGARYLQSEAKKHGFELSDEEAITVSYQTYNAERISDSISYLSSKLDSIFNPEGLIGETSLISDLVHVLSSINQNIMEL